MNPEFNELDLEMVMDKPLRAFLHSLGYHSKVRHCVDGRYMVVFFTATCSYNLQYAPPPNNLLAVVRQPHEKTPSWLKLESETIFHNELSKDPFGIVLKVMFLSEVELGDRLLSL